MEPRKIIERIYAFCQQTTIHPLSQLNQQKRWKVDTNARLDSILLISSVNLPGGELIPFGFSFWIVYFVEAMEEFLGILVDKFQFLNVEQITMKWAPVTVVILLHMKYKSISSQYRWSVPTLPSTYLLSTYQSTYLPAYVPNFLSTYN